MRKNIKASQVKDKDIMAVVTFVRVDRRYTGFDGTGIRLKDLDDGKQFDVIGSPLIETMFSADRYIEEQEVSKTQAVEILMRSYNQPFTVFFVKADGSERKLRGRLVHSEALFGRSVVEDLDKPVDPEAKTPAELQRRSQVDHRSIFCIIVGGICYIVKGNKNKVKSLLNP